ncbi:MAG: PD40 domain-containing protein, partial [Bacteroidales bacterium]|nr:PD40 domain-containing protein [Bacteroidales bacterium]
KKLVFVSDKKLWMIPMSGNLGPGFSGAPVQLNTDGMKAGWGGEAWSADGRWIAFNEYPLIEDTLMKQGICLVHSEGGIPIKVIESYRDARLVNYRISLSPDGKELAFSSVEDNKQHIYTIPVEGSDPMKLIQMEAREPAYSPDGKLIAFVADRGKGRGAGNLGLWVVPSEGGDPHLIADAGKASSPVWSPDGSMIAYLDYNLEQKIFIVRIDKTGHAIEKPVSLNAPVGTSNVSLLAGWTSENKIGALLIRDQESALYTLPVNGGQAAMILHNTLAYQPRWSPDGDQIFYTELSKDVDETLFWGFMSRVSANGGKGNPLPQNQDGNPLKLFLFQGGNRISPDGKMIIAGGWKPADVSSEYFYPKARIWKLAIDGSETTQLTSADGPFLDGSPSWSPDGTKVAFGRVHFSKGKTNQEMGEAEIYIVDSFGGEPELLATDPGKGISSLVWSPDGKMIAYFSQDKEPEPTSYMNVINVANGTTRIVGEVPFVNVWSELAWSPDSKRIAFNDIKSNLIKVMSLSDGAIEDIQTGLNNVNIWDFDWSPDGKRFVFAGWKGGNKEFWLMENFLPLIKAKK